MKKIVLAVIMTFSVLSAHASNTPTTKINLTDEMACLVEAIYFEARNQPTIGQVAVAQVILNRVESKRFPDSICTVVNQPRQFSYRYDVPVLRYSDKIAYRKAMQIAETTYFDMIFDITDGATMYHATRILPKWDWTKLTETVTINDHVFYIHH